MQNGTSYLAYSFYFSDTFNSVYYVSSVEKWGTMYNIYFTISSFTQFTFYFLFYFFCTSQDVEIFYLKKFSLYKSAHIHDRTETVGEAFFVLNINSNKISTEVMTLRFMFTMFEDVQYMSRY